MRITHCRVDRLGVGLFNPYLMSLQECSLLNIESLSENDVLSLFKTTEKIKKLYKSNSNHFLRMMRDQSLGREIALLFFEPSTRTRSSFEMAAHRLGFNVTSQSFAGKNSGESSRAKGETLLDTIRTIEAMEPALMVVRFSGQEEVVSYLEKSRLPVISAGSGALSHPTQALLDAFTIQEEFGDIAGQKVLIVGDIKYSRVAASNINLLQNLGAEVALCGPDAMMPEDLSVVENRRFSIDEGIRWASVVMSLRIQFERHEEEKEISRTNYFTNYGMNLERVKKIKGIFMHPMPVNYGVELAQEVVDIPCARLFTQVQNGVYIRAALMAEILGLQVN